MKRIFLENVFAAYEIDRWASDNNAKIIRCQIKEKGAVVLFIECPPSS